MEKLRILVGGYIGLYPVGGATWDYIQYPLGLAKLGHEVYYLEDTMQYPVFQKEGTAWNDASPCIRYLKTTMDYFGMADKWIYRDVATGKSFGMSEHQLQDICRTADLFINISCSTFLREEYMQIPRRVLIDSDPMFTQIQLAIESAGGEEAKHWTTRRMVENHTHLFSFGENIGAPGCRIPTFGYQWLATHQPICLDYWQKTSTTRKGLFTTIMNWSGRKKLWYEGEAWGQKDVEFMKFTSMPVHTTEATFEVVVNPPLNSESTFDSSQLTTNGWRILDPTSTVGNLGDYQRYIQSSAAEFSVAKETYVKSSSGWFSCRSACYLAAGKPVVAQDTGWTRFLPTGSGLFAFTDTASALEAIYQVQARYDYHAEMARQVAHEYFDSRRVLQTMLDQACQTP